jgi:hypothetical protein
MRQKTSVMRRLLTFPRLGNSDFSGAEVRQRPGAVRSIVRLGNQWSQPPPIPRDGTVTLIGKLQAK